MSMMSRMRHIKMLWLIEVEMEVLAAMALFGLFVVFVFALLLMLFCISRYALFLIQSISGQRMSPTRLMATVSFVFLEQVIKRKTAFKIFLFSVFLCALIVVVIATKQIVRH
jgi:hypothetical protein